MIGHLNGTKIALDPNASYTRIGGKTELQTTSAENGFSVIDWKTHLATGVELHFIFDRPVYLALLTLPLDAGCEIEQAEVLDKSGRCIGKAKIEEGSLTAEPCARGTHFTLRIIPTLTDFSFGTPQFYGASCEDAMLYPTPKSVKWLNGTQMREKLLSVSADTNPDTAFAALHFAELAQKRWRSTISKGSFLQFLIDDTLPQDAYHLKITSAEAKLSASNRLGLLYGIERLFELEKDGSLPCCEIEDAPYKEMRGVHLYLPKRSNIEFTKSLIKNILIPFHYNQLYIEFAGGMRFDSHPEISEAWLEGNRRAKNGEIPPFPHGTVAGGTLLEKSEVRELCDFARELGFELIPEVQSFGHVQYITYAHPEIAEIDPEQENTDTDAREADIPPSLFYKHSYCPQNKKSYAIIHDLIDEIVEVVRPQRFVHCGHDEIYQLGLCPKCKNVPRDVLYEMHVRDLHDYLEGKGLHMMLWADMVQPVSKYQCYPALDRLPKDIVWLDFIWYFHTGKDIEQNLLEKDYRVMIGNLYSSHFPRFEKRIKPLLGGEVSFWALTEEASIAREGKFYDLMYTAEMLWSESYCEQARNAYATTIAKRLPQVRTTLRKEPPLQVQNALDFKKEKEMPFYNEIKGAFLRNSLTIPANQCVDGLRFIHTTLYRERRIAWKKLVEIGSYTVLYEDGTEIEIPVTYDGNVRCFKYRFGEPLQGGYYRHEGYVCAWDSDPIDGGYTPDGTPITLYALNWHNPHPDKKIRSVVCREYADSAAGLLLCDISLLKG